MTYYSRTIEKKYRSQLTAEGKGAFVRRSIGSEGLGIHDPFIFLDSFTLGLPSGFVDHAHRGLETVTYILESSKGSTCHEDFLGNKGILNPGDVQFMNSGKGIIHAEMPLSHEPCLGLQLWVNLAGKHKMSKPKYTELSADKILHVEQNRIVAKVLSGSSFDSSYPATTKIYTKTPTHLVHYTMPPNSVLYHVIPPHWNAFIYALQGDGSIGEKINTANEKSNKKDIDDSDIDISPIINNHHCLFLSTNMVEYSITEDDLKKLSGIITSSKKEVAKNVIEQDATTNDSINDNINDTKTDDTITTNIQINSSNSSGSSDSINLTTNDMAGLSLHKLTQTQLQPHGVLIYSGSQGLQFYLGAGEPLNETVVQRGPFVMNTEAQVEKAFRDWQTQSNGFENAKKWKSEIASGKGFLSNNGTIGGGKGEQSTSKNRKNGKKNDNFDDDFSSDDNSSNNKKKMKNKKDKRDNSTVTTTNVWDDSDDEGVSRKGKGKKGKR